MRRLTTVVAAVMLVGVFGCASEPEYTRLLGERPAEIRSLDAAAAEATYVVQPGDTLASIAASHRATVADLSTLNDITDIDRIAVGDRLVLSTDPAVAAEPVHPQAINRDLPAEPGVFAALPRRVDLDGWRGPTFLALAIGGTVAAVAALFLLGSSGWWLVDRGAHRIWRGSRWLAAVTRLDRGAETVGRAFAQRWSRATRRVGGGVAGGWTRLYRRLGAAVSSRRTPRTTAREAGERRRLPGLLVGVARGLVRIGGQGTTSVGRGARWIVQAVYRGAGSTARRGRATAERAIERSRGQRREAERAALHIRLTQLGAAELQLGLIDAAEDEIRLAMNNLEPSDVVGRGVCLVRLAEALIRRDAFGEASRCLDDGLSAVGEAGPPATYRQIRALQFRLAASRVRI